MCYVQFEVESKLNREATVRELSFGWSDHLWFLNNRGVDINEIVGFYVPVGHGCVEKVTCTWKKEKLCYKMTPTKFQDMLTEIRAVYTTQSGYQLESTHRIMTLPLIPAYVRNTWGLDAYKLTLGGSIVIMCPTLTQRELGILHYYGNSRSNLAYCSFPIGELTNDTILQVSCIPKAPEQK